MVVDLGAASPPDCLHDAVVPFPGGFGPIVICQLPVATAFASPVATDHAVFFDHSISGLIPFDVSGPAAPLGASCPSPPSIDFDGTATRCFP